MQSTALKRPSEPNIAHGRSLHHPGTNGSAEAGKASCFLSLIPFVRLNFSVSSFWVNRLLVSMFKLPKSVCTNIVDHFVCRLLQLTFGFYRIDHLKCLIESEHRRLAKPLAPPTIWRSSDAMYQIELDLIDTRTFQSVLWSVCVMSAQYILIEAWGCQQRYLGTKY